MNTNDTFKAIIKVHDLYDDLMDTDVDEESGEEVEAIIFQIEEVIEGNYEMDEDLNQIHVDPQRVKELIDEPINNSEEYEAVLTNEYVAEKDRYELRVEELKLK